MDFQSPQNGMYDPSSFIDPSAMAGSQMNGTRPYPMSSIPQKRDSTGATLSRSQTPSQQPQFGFQQGFAHTPSPTMQNQHFRPGQMAPQRMQTGSPAQNPHAPQLSPMAFPQPSPMSQGFDPNAGGQFPVQQVQLSQNLQNRQQEAQRQYAMRLQQQQQQMGNVNAGNMAAQQRHHGGQMPGGPGQQHPGMPPNMMAGQMQNSHAQTQAFLKNVGALMNQSRRPFNPNPVTSFGRPVNLQQLYQFVLKHKGSRYVTHTQSWPRIAQMVGMLPQQFPSAPEELRTIYENNLGPYEHAYMAKQQAMKMQMQPQMGGGMGQQMSPTRQPVPPMQNNSSAQREYLQQLQRNASMQQPQQRPSEGSVPPQPQPQQSQFDQSSQPQPQQPPQSTPMQNNASLAMNGRSTPQADANQHRKSMSRQLEGTPTQGQEGATTSASPMKQGENLVKSESVPPEKKRRPSHVNVGEDGSRIWSPSYRMQDKWGGIDFETSGFLQLMREIELYKPNVPRLQDMGVVDIRALTMSIRSGLHAETRLALDTLAQLTHEQSFQLELDKCGDLVDVLVDYADDQLEHLANDNPEVSDILDLTPYEDILHHCRAESRTLQDLPEFGTKEYDLERTADRLLAITSIFRNLSFLEINHNALASPTVLSFLSNAIRLVGTRVLLLRSHINTFDFMKDLITFFSNTSTRIALPSREDAYTILHFLCAFAPCPRPGTPVKFTPYDPKVHRYLPSAVDSLAKLLARDDPNRTFYKQIFINEATSTPPYDLLTRSFALAVSVVPDRSEGILFKISETSPNQMRAYETRIAEARKAYLMQGMLAADILASLAPGPETGLCRSWLETEDSWATNLINFAMSLSAADANIQHPPPPPNHRGQRQPMEHDREGFQLIVHRALSMLKRLGDKSIGIDPLVRGVQTNGHTEEEDEEDEDMEMCELGGTKWKVKANFVPKKETLLGALLTSALDGRSLRQYCGIGYLAEG